MQCTVYTSFQLDFIWLTLRHKKTTTTIPHNEECCLELWHLFHSVLLCFTRSLSQKAVLFWFLTHSNQPSCLWTSVWSSYYAKFIQGMSMGWCTKEHSLKVHIRTLQKLQVKGGWQVGCFYSEVMIFVVLLRSMVHNSKYCCWASSEKAR